MTKLVALADESLLRFDKPRAQRSDTADLGKGRSHNLLGVYIASIFVRLRSGWCAAKLRDDQRAAQADVAVIVSTALPDGLDTFDLVGNIWIVKPRFATPVATALRQALVGIAGARLSQVGQQTKMELVYEYLTASRFRHRVEAIVERFTEMQTELERELRTMTRLWAKREEQLRAVLDSTVGLYGDLEGIAGRVMHEIESLNALAIAAADDRSVV